MSILALGAGKELLRNFTWLGIILGLLGIYTLYRIKVLYFTFTFIIIFCNLFLALVYGHGQRFEQEFSSYLLPTYAIFSLYIASGIYGIFEFVENYLIKKHRNSLSFVNPILYLLFSALPIYLLFINYPIIADIKKDTPRKFGQEILEEIPKDSIVVVRNVFTDFITLYLQQVEGYRKDILFISINRDMDIPTEWKEWMKLQSKGKPIYLEYDIIAMDNLENYFFPSLYFGRLYEHTTYSIQFQDLPSQDSKWDKMINNLQIKKVSYRPIIIDSFHPFALSRHNLSILYAKRGLWQKAFAESYAASEYEPNYPEPYLSRGIWNLNLKQPEKAKANLETCVRLNPINHDAWLNLGTACAQLSEYEKAISCFNHSLKINPLSYQSYANLGLAYLQLKEYTKAESNFRDAIELNPKNPFLWFKLAQTLDTQGKTAESRQTWQKVLELDPKNTQAKEALKNLDTY